MADILCADSKLLRLKGLILGYLVIMAGEYALQGSIQNLSGKEYEARKEEMYLENLVNADMPRTFIWYTFEDDEVSVQDSLFMVNALIAH